MGIFCHCVIREYPLQACTYLSFAVLACTSCHANARPIQLFGSSSCPLCQNALANVARPTKFHRTLLRVSQRGLTEEAVILSSQRSGRDFWRNDGLGCLLCTFTSSKWVASPNQSSYVALLDTFCLGLDLLLPVRTTVKVGMNQKWAMRWSSSSSSSGGHSSRFWRNSSTS